MGSIDDIKSTLTQSALDALCEKFHIPDIVHPELPGRNNRIHNSPTSKIGLYTRFFDFANYRIPLSQFLVDVLEYFQINLSQLSVIAAAKFPNPFLCFVGISRYYEFDDDVYPVFLTDDDEGQTPLLESTKGRVVPLAGVDDQGDQNDDVQDAGNQNDDVQDAKDEVSSTGIEKARGTRKKRKAVGGASGSTLPPKNLRADHGSSGAGASTGGKSVAALQGLLERNTLHVEVGVTAVATLPFITSSVSLTQEREGDGRKDYVTGPNLRTQHPAERFVISPDSYHHSSATTADDEVTSIVRSSAPPPPVLTATVATTAIAGATSAPVYESGIGPVQRSIFRDFASPSTAGADVAGPSQPAGAELAPPGFFSQLRGIDYDRLFVEFNVRVARQACFSAEVRLRS
ncbi:hypothetical protein Tco_1367206 [Tanacetum coccineum]